MKARFVSHTYNGVNQLQIIISAEDDNERILLNTFVAQLRDRGIHLHGYGLLGGNIGVENLNFGSKHESHD